MRRGVSIKTGEGNEAEGGRLVSREEMAPERLNAGQPQTALDGRHLFSAGGGRRSCEGSGFDGGGDEG